MELSFQDYYITTQLSTTGKNLELNDHRHKLVHPLQVKKTYPKVEDVVQTMNHDHF
jgi:hypothetical protein